MRPVLAGKHVAITEHGAPLARISPDYERPARLQRFSFPPSQSLLSSFCFLLAAYLLAAHLFLGATAAIDHLHPLFEKTLGNRFPRLIVLTWWLHHPMPNDP